MCRYKDIRCKTLQLKNREHESHYTYATNNETYTDVLRSVIDIIYPFKTSLWCRTNTRYTHLTGSHRYMGAAILLKYLKLYLNISAR